MKSVALVLIGILVSSSALGQQWESLLPGASSVGEWSLEGDEIVGRASGAGATLWRAGGQYWDFELEVEFKASAASGAVQYRSHWLPKVVGDGVDGHQLYGYGAAIDPQTKGASGAIVDVNGRGDLVAATKDSEETVRPGEWNRMSVVARGTVSEVRINGMTVSILSDEAMIGGLVGFRIDDGEIRFRNARIRDLGRVTEWQSLFDGKTLEGWKNWGSEKWLVEDGVIQGRRGPKESEGYLATVETWKDFRVRGQFLMRGDGNYGLFYHSTIRLREDGYPLISGVQGEVEPEYPGETGWHYESYRRGWLLEPAKDTVEAYALLPGVWNEIEIRSVGNHITSWVNGFRTTDFSDASPQLFEGSFALQLHAGEGTGIDWRGLHVEVQP